MITEAESALIVKAIERNTSGGQQDQEAGGGGENGQMDLGETPEGNEVGEEDQDQSQAEAALPLVEEARERRRRKRKRDVTPSSQVFRIAASNVAVAVGLNPFKCILEFVTECLYQDLEALYHADATAMGLEILDREEEVERLLAKIGGAASVDLQKARASAIDATKVKTVEDAAKSTKEISQAIKKAAKSARVNQKDLQVIQEVILHDLHTTFGQRHEENAIQAYEALTHSEVHSRNNRWLCWNFPEDVAQLQPPPPPPSSLTARPAGRRAVKSREHSCAGKEAIGVVIEGSEGEHEGQQEKEAQIEDSQKQEKEAKKEVDNKEGGVDDALEVAMKHVSREQILDTSLSQELPLADTVLCEEDSLVDDRKRNASVYFKVVGFIDGCKDELDASAQDPNDWRMRSVVIEVKHRLTETSFRNPPPVYEQLQLVLYMLMIGVEHGDLVQCLRHHSTRRRGRKKGHAADDEEETSSAKQMIISRILLDGDKGEQGRGGINHRKAFHDHVVPNLYNFVRFIYRLREDDTLRRQWIASEEKNQWAFVQSELPHLPRERPGSFWKNHKRTLAPTPSSQSSEDEVKKKNCSSSSVPPESATPPAPINGGQSNEGKSSSRCSGRRSKAKEHDDASPPTPSASAVLPSNRGQSSNEGKRSSRSSGRRIRAKERGPSSPSTPPSASASPVQLRSRARNGGVQSVPPSSSSSAAAKRKRASPSSISSSQQRLITEFMPGRGASAAAHLSGKGEGETVDEDGYASKRRLRRRQTV